MAIDTTEASLYGTGRGAAYVWGPNKGLQGLQQAYQQDQLRRQKEDAELADQVAKINYDSARDADLPEIMKRYEGVKNTFAKIRGTQNSMERIKLQSELNQQKAELSRAVAISKQAGQQEGELGKLPLSNPDNVSDDFVPSYSRLRKTSVFSPDYQKQAEYITANGIMPKFDSIGTAKKLADASIVNIPESGVKTQILPDGSKSYYTETAKKLDKNALSENVARELQRNRGMRNEVARLYPDMPFQDAVKAYSDDLYEGLKGKYDVVSRSGASAVKPDNWREKADYQDMLIRNRAKDGINTLIGIPQPITIPYAKGKANVEFDEYVPISVSKKNFAGSPYIDLKTGKEAGKLPSSSDYEIVGVGNAPFITEGNFKGAISQPNFARQNPQSIERRPIVHVQVPPTGGETRPKDYFVPFDRLPENVKNSKSVREALSKFKPATKQSQPTAKPINGVKASSSTLDFFKQK